MALKVLAADMMSDEVARRRLVVYEGGHVPPAELMLRTIDPWLDEMLGRVRREQRSVLTPAA